jgi:hypothetical protein
VMAFRTPNGLLTHLHTANQVARSGTLDKIGNEWVIV